MCQFFMLVKPPDLRVIEKIPTALSLPADMRSFYCMIDSRQTEQILVLAAIFLLIILNNCGLPCASFALSNSSLFFFHVLALLGATLPV